MGKSWLGPRIVSSDACSSTPPPPGARASARTVPTTSTDVSCVSWPHACPAASGTSFFDTTASTYPVPSRSITKAILPLARVGGSPALGETVVAVGVAERVVALLDRATGQVLWRTRLRGAIHAGPLLEEERLYVATEAPEGRVYALRLRDGRTLWSTKMESVVAPLALERDAIYAATERGTVLRLGVESGAVAWRRHLPGAVRAAPVATPFGLAVATAADTLYLLAKTSGEGRAPLATPGAGLAAPALAESRPYFGTTGGHVLAVELPDRKSTRLNSSHSQISYAVFCLKKKKNR